MREFIAFTGHRPAKLGGYSTIIFDRLVGLAESYLCETDALWLISGMALGWDMAGAQAALNLRIPLLAAVPFSGQENRWPEASQKQYRRLLEAARDVVVISPGGYAASKMFTRDRWMVDNCHKVCALFDGSPSGTGKTVEYATGRVPIDNLWSRWASA